ncbi:hypothetical protein FRC04_004144, partial [Tulasnella sp. 424]
MGVSEFIMADRLWNSKSIKSERLVTLIPSAILSHRFKFVTTLAYGRLAQDTRSLVFSKAVPALLDVPSSSRAGSPAVPASPLPISIFSTSTFDRDALVHIFGLLRALDTHAFQLITNLNLTRGIAKSRTKDLWIFDCPADPPSLPHSQHAPSIGGGGSPHSSLLGMPGFKGKEPGRVMSVATATTAGMAGLGAAASNGFYATPEGQAHIRAATAPSPLSKERPISTDSETEAVFAAHTRASSCPLPGTLERRPSLLKKHPPAAFVTGEKPKRKDSTGSMGSIRDKSRPIVEPQVVVRPPEDPNPIPPPPPFTPGYLYQSQAPTTFSAVGGPLSESEYAYGCSGVYDAQTPKGAHPDSEYMYKQYVPPPPPPAGAAPGAVIYSTNPTGKRPPESPSPQSPGTEEGLLSADAFRETSYSGTSGDPPPTWTGTYSGPASPTDSQNTHTRHDHPPQERQQVTPRTAHVPLPQQPEMSVQYTGMEGRPKSEKAFMGIIPPPPPSTYPLPSAVPVPIPLPEERPGAPRMETTTSAGTVLPPGGYPKTPMESGTSVRIVPVDKVASPASPASTTARPRQASQGTVGAKKSTPVRTLSRKSAQDPASDGKGWVLVNVEPSRKTSIDAAVAAMDAAAAANARARNRSTSSSPALNNAGMVTEGTMMESPVESFSRRGHIRDNTIDTLDSPVDQHAGTEESAAISSLRRGKGSLKKKQRSGSSDDSQKKKRFLGLFSRSGSSKSKGGHKKVASEPFGRFTEEPIGERGEYEATSPVSDDRLDERDDSVRAVGGVKESTWRR